MAGEQENPDKDLKKADAEYEDIQLKSMMKMALSQYHEATEWDLDISAIQCYTQCVIARSLSRIATAVEQVAETLKNPDVNVAVSQILNDLETVIEDQV